MGPILQNFNVTDAAANSDYRYSWYQSHHESPQMYGTNVWYKCMVQMYGTNEHTYYFFYGMYRIAKNNGVYYRVRI